MLIKLTDISKKYNFIPKGVIHLGAHLGEEATVYNELGIKKVLWIEGNPALFNKLNDNLRKYEGQVALNYLVSDINGEEVDFHIANDSQASSLFDLKHSKIHHPNIHMTKTIRTHTKRMDRILIENKIEISDFNFLNIDLQGAELLAMKGFGELLNKIDFIYLEINLAKLYSKNPKLSDIDKFLSSFGFRRVETVITKWQWGDALYKRAGISSFQLFLSTADAKVREWINQLSYLNSLGRQYALEQIIKNKYLRKIVGYFNPKVKTILFDMNMNGEKFYLEKALGKLNPEENIIIFDVGANTGAYSQMASNVARQNQQKFEIHLFEPQQTCINVLQEKFYQSEPFIINNYGLSDNKTTQKIYFNNKGSSQSSLYKREQVNLPNEDSIQLDTLENYLDTNLLPKIDMLKIDVEGNELKVIKGCGKYLNPTFIKNIQFEYGATFKDAGISLKEVFEILTKAGYKIGRLNPKSITILPYSSKLENLKYCNYIATSQL